jgi:hypothetical protein
MVGLAFLVASFLGAALAFSDDRLVRLNRRMPIADFEEANLVARFLTSRLGEEGGWLVLQGCGIAAFAAMILIAFLYPLLGWTVVGIFAAGLALVLFDILHDSREMRVAAPSRSSLGVRRSADRIRTRKDPGDWDATSDS